MISRTERRQRRRLFLVKVGVYFAILAGVVAQSAIRRFDAKALTIDLDFGVLSVTRIVVALIVATMVYWRLDGSSGEMVGKSANVGRVLTLGFTSGYTLMGIAGIGE